MAKKIVFIVHAPPYGSERCLSALRLAAALAAREDAPELTLFMMSDATVVGLPNQQERSGAALQTYIETLVEAGASIKLCKSCARARGLEGLDLIDGVHIGDLGELAEQVMTADQVVTF